MRVRYGSEIVPIQLAYESRNKLAEEQRNLRAKDPTSMFDFDASQLSLNQLMKNPSLQYRGHSGATLEKQASDIASVFQRELRNPQGRWSGILSGIFGPQYYERITSNGLSIDEVMRTIMNDPRGNQILKEMGNSVLESSGIKDWGSEDAINTAMEYINRGLFQAVGKSDIDRVANQDLDYKQQLNLIAARQAGSGKPPELPANFYRATERIAADKDVKTTQLNDYKKFLHNNSYGIISGTLKDGISVSTSPSITGVASGTSVQPGPKQELDRISKEVGFPIKTQEDIQRAQEALQNKIGSSVYGRQAYEFTTREVKPIIDYLAKAVTSNRNEALTIIDRETGDITKQRKSDRQLEDFIFDEDKTGNNLVYDPRYGFTWNYIDDKGKAKSILLKDQLFDNLIEASPSGTLMSDRIQDVRDLIESGTIGEDYIVNPYTGQYEAVYAAQPVINEVMTRFYNGIFGANVPTNQGSQASQQQVLSPTIYAYGGKL